MPYKDKEIAKEYHKMYMRKYRERCPHYKKGGKYFEKHREWREKNIEHKKNYDKMYSQTENGKIVKVKSIKKYNKTNKGKASKQRAQFKRLTKIRNAINTLTSQEWEDILEVYNYRCAYCDIEFNCELLPTKDHIIPLIKGGNNTKENIAPACKSCNSRKQDKSIEPTPAFN